MKITKAIGYAYPSSTIAVKNGFALTGCYFVQFHGENWETVSMKGFCLHKADAIKEAAKHKCDWHHGYKRYYDVNNNHENIKTIVTNYLAKD